MFAAMFNDDASRTHCLKKMAAYGIAAKVSRPLILCISLHTMDYGPELLTKNVSLWGVESHCRLRGFPAFQCLFEARRMLQLGRFALRVHIKSWCARLRV